MRLPDRLIVLAVLIALLVAVLLLPACNGGLTIGPTTAREFIIVTDGNPIRILENRTVLGERLDGKGPASVDIGGWVAMPVAHFEALKRAVEKAGGAVAGPEEGRWQ